jgi:hypothetical protein
MKNTILTLVRLGSTTLIGIILGMIAMIAMHYLSMIFYPLPETVTMEDPEALNAYMKIAPLGALILVIISHSVGPFIATISAILLSRFPIWNNTTFFKYQHLFLGLLFTYFGWYNLQELSHPDWFKIDLLFYLPSAYLGRYLVVKNNLKK